MKRNKSSQPKEEKSPTRPEGGYPGDSFQSSPTPPAGIAAEPSGAWILGILVVFILYIGFVVYKDFLFFEKVFLFKDIGSDTINEHYPHYVHLSDYLRSDGIPRWSFHQGMGQNIFPYSLNDPVALILSFFPRQHIPYAVVYVHFLKILLSGVFFYLYLKILRVSGFAALVGSLLYSFCGYAILGGTWSSPSTETVYAAFLLYAFERFLKQNRWGLVPVAAACIGAHQPFFLYLYSMFLLVYATFRFVEENGMAAGAARPFAIFISKLVGLGLLGLAMSSVYLMSSVLQMMQSPRVSGEASYAAKFASEAVFGFGKAIEYQTILMRLFSSDLLGTGTYFKGWENYFEAPTLYCGVIGLLLVPQFFSLAAKKLRFLYGAGCLIALTPVVFPHFRHMFWLFTGDYYRSVSLFLTIVLLFFAARALAAIVSTSKINLNVLMVTAGVLVAVLFFPYSDARGASLPVDGDLRLAMAAFLLLDAVLLGLIGSGKLVRPARMILMASIAVELAYGSFLTTNFRPVITGNELRQKTGYNDHTADAVNFLNSTDTGFFRVVKDYTSSPAMHYGINDGKIQRFRSASSYYSFNQIHYIRFLGEMGVIDPKDEYATRWADGIEKAPTILKTVLGVKYALTKRNATRLERFGFEFVRSFGDVQIFKNTYFLPLGFTYDTCMLYTDFTKLDNAAKSAALLRAFVIDPARTEAFNGFGSVRDIPRVLTPDEFGMTMDRLNENVLALTGHRQNRIAGRLFLDRRKLLFLSIPYDQGWKALVDGLPHETHKVNIGFTGLVLDPGEHRIELTYEPPLVRIGAMMSALGFLIYGGLLVFQKVRRC